MFELAAVLCTAVAVFQLVDDVLAVEPAFGAADIGLFVSDLDS